MYTVVSSCWERTISFPSFWSYLWLFRLNFPHKVLIPFTNKFQVSPRSLSSLWKKRQNVLSFPNKKKKKKKQKQKERNQNKTENRKIAVDCSAGCSNLLTSYFIITEKKQLDVKKIFYLYFLNWLFFKLFFIQVISRLFFASISTFVLHHFSGVSFLFILL